MKARMVRLDYNGGHDPFDYARTSYNALYYPWGPFETEPGLPDTGDSTKKSVGVAQASCVAIAFVVVFAVVSVSVIYYRNRN